MSTEERIKEDFSQWVEAIPKPNEYNRMYGHHLTSFKAGSLSERNKTIEEIREEIEKEKKRSLNQTTRSHADISYECGLDFILRLLDSTKPTK